MLHFFDLLLSPPLADLLLLPELDVVHLLPLADLILQFLVPLLFRLEEYLYPLRLCIHWYHLQTTLFNIYFYSFDSLLFTSSIIVSYKLVSSNSITYSFFTTGVWSSFCSEQGSITYVGYVIVLFTFSVETAPSPPSSGEDNLLVFFGVKDSSLLSVVLSPLP